jgi:hypothetical protein
VKSFGFLSEHCVLAAHVVENGAPGAFVWQALHLEAAHKASGAQSIMLEDALNRLSRHGKHVHAWGRYWAINNSKGE